MWKEIYSCNIDGYLLSMNEIFYLATNLAPVNTRLENIKIEFEKGQIYSITELKKSMKETIFYYPKIMKVFINNAVY